jgi:biopolymer transport protein TolR
MAMSTGGGGLTNEPNVTPMIDVLLVLIIIFMVILPMSRKAIDVQLPDPTPSVAPANSISNQIVLEVKPDPAGSKDPIFAVNTEVVPKDKLLARLTEIYKGRPEKIIFIKGDPAVAFQDVINAMDMARGAGVLVIGATPKDTKGK